MNRKLSKMPTSTGFREECYDELVQILESFEFKEFKPKKSDYHKNPDKPECLCYHFRSERDFIEVHLRDWVEVYRIADGPFLSEYRSGIKIEFAYDTFISLVKAYFGWEVLIGVIDS